jgi:hypothetical protein
LACHLQIDADPDPDLNPAYNFDADPDSDPTFQFDAVPDPDRNSVNNTHVIYPFKKCMLKL